MAQICAIYVRKSKANDNSDSMETQIHMCKEYLERNYQGCIIRIYDKDYGITGHSIKKRKDFQRMMEDVRNGIINVVAIQRYDRIARNTRDFCNIYHDMERVGCGLVSVSQDIDTSTPYGKKFMYDLASTAELEWALNSERHKDVNKYARINRKCNLSPYALPFGYKAKKIDGIRKVVFDTEVEPIVRDMIDYYRKCESKAETVRYINQKYSLNKSHALMDTFIRSDFYHGSYREVNDYCPAYLSEEEHNEIRKISKKYVRHYSDDKNYFLFTGLLICPVCGRRMESQSQINTSGNRYYYYRCPATYKSGNCSFKGNVNEKSIEEWLVTFLFDQIKTYSDKVDYSFANGKKTSDLGKYKAELDRLNKLYLKGRIEEDFYDSEYERIQNIINENSMDEEPQQKYSIAELEQIFSDNWQNEYFELSRKSKRNFWKKYIRKIEFNTDKTLKTVDFL